MTSSHTNPTVKPVSAGGHLRQNGLNLLVWAPVTGEPIHTQGDYTIRSSPLEAGNGGSVLFAGIGDMLLRITTPAHGNNIEGPILDIQQSATDAPQRIKLGPRLIEVLHYLVKRQGTQVDNTQIMRDIWGDERSPSSLVTSVRRIRDKLGPGLNDIIETRPRSHFIGVSEAASALNGRHALELRDARKSAPRIRLKVDASTDEITAWHENRQISISSMEKIILNAFLNSPEATLTTGDLLQVLGLSKSERNVNLVAVGIVRFRRNYGKQSIITRITRSGGHTYQLNLQLEQS